MADLILDDPGREVIRKAGFIDSQSNVRIRTSATSTFSGLSTDQEITTLIVGTTATTLPATPLTGRNAIGVHNTDTIATLFIGKSTVTADSVIGVTSGWEVGPNDSVHLDITDSVVLFGRIASGTIKVKVWELA